jgi:hypothetical protein
MAQSESAPSEAQIPETTDDEIPPGFEVVSSSYGFDELVRQDAGVVISVHNVCGRRHDVEEYDYRVIGAQNQVGFYDGAFPNMESAWEKVLELGREKAAS